MNGTIKTYRDTPKSGETDAGWCAYRAVNGHIVALTAGHATEDEARAAVAA